MIESHVHLSLDGDHDPVTQCINDTDGMVFARSYRNALKHLSSGTTTVRDQGAKNFAVIDLRNAVNSGMLWGQRILSPARTITITGGHTYYWNGEADGVEGI